MSESAQGGSNINPLALLFLVAMCFLMLCPNRRSAVAALLLTAAFIPLGQQIVFLGLHFFFLRIVILLGLVRVLMRRESQTFQLVSVDKLFLGWVITLFTCELLRGASAETFGAVYNSVGIYFLVRVLTRGSEDTLAHLKVLAVVGIVFGACMAWESMTHRNPFFILGGVPEITQQRGDQFRCQGPFRHPILAGTFAATLFPLTVGLWFQGRPVKKLALLSSLACLIATVTSASSGPMLTILAAMIGLALWPLRQRMSLVRWSIVSVFIGFSLVMNAPVWYLIAKISDMIGGGGWHRSYLIDQFVGHFNEWWLTGTSYTAHWAPAGLVLTVNPNMMDITNHYVAQGIGGGIWALGLFLWIIVISFQTVGRSVHDKAQHFLDRRLVWGFGVALASHCTAFLSVSYFDQINAFWFWLLAAITTLSEAGSQRASAHSQKEAFARVGNADTTACNDAVGQVMFSRHS